MVVHNWQQARRDHRTQQSEAIAATTLSLITERGAPALTMAAIADAAGIARQTLYRYYPDIDAVLVGIAEFIASHDDHVEAHVHEQADPVAQLEVIIRTVAETGDHSTQATTDLRATLPPQAREVLARHQDRIVQLLANVLQTGIDDGVFRGDLEPSTDAPLILGLAVAAEPRSAERAITLVHQMVDPEPQENPR